MEKIDTIRKLGDERIKDIADSGKIETPEGVQVTINETPTREIRKVVNDIIQLDKPVEESEETVTVENRVEEPDASNEAEMEKILASIEKGIDRIGDMLPEDHKDFDRVTEQRDNLKRELQEMRNTLLGEGWNAETANAEAQMEAVN